MKNKLFFWAFTMVLTFGLLAISCDNGTGGGSSSDNPDPVDPAVEAMNAEDFGAEASVTTYNISNKTSFTTATAEIEATAGNYVLNITGTITVGDADAGINPAVNSVISLRGGGTIHKSTDTYTNLFYLTNSDSKLILRDVTLKGHASNDTSLVGVSNSTASFVMLGGTISGNSTSDSGGGVYVASGTFNMEGGTISGNSSSGYGGGVYVNASNGGTFTTTGGTIYGNVGAPNGNRAIGDTKGHAVFVDTDSTDKYRNTTAGSEDNISVPTDLSKNQGEAPWL